MPSLPAGLRIHSPRSQLLTSLVAALGLAAVSVAASASCSSDETTTTAASASSGGSGTASSTTAASGGGGAASSASVGGTGGGGAGGCTGPADCVNEPGKVCDVTTGACVQCLPSDDNCIPGQYCTADDTCEVGCTDQGDCTAETTCDTATHQCVGCVIDTDCPSGSICISEQCLAGCSGTQPCQPGFTCCGQTCFNVSSDAAHCGDCQTVCDAPPNAGPLCDNGNCTLGQCNAGWADCNLDPADGCEWNTLQDGPCLCTPGDTQTCYTGAAGTENVGLCKGGISTCLGGVAWGSCMGQVLPAAELCNQLDDDCDGAIEPQPCEQCVPNTGMCMGQVGKSCKPDGLGYVFETCDPLLQGTTCNPATGTCDGECGYTALGSSYIGCDYYPTVTANQVLTQFHFAVAVSNTTNSVATITVTKGGLAVTSTTVAANSVKVLTLPWETTLKGPESASAIVPFPASVLVPQGAYRLRTNHPVTVYQFNPLEYTLGPTTFSYTNDASLLLPVNVWTGKYRVAARHHFGGTPGGTSGFYAVTAKEDATTVTVAAGPNSGIVKSGVAGIATTGNGSVVLNAGDVLEVVTNTTLPVTFPPTSDPNDVSGTLVTASKPVQVIGGHQCIYIPADLGYCDHLEESMFPVETLSTAYLVTAPLIPTGGSTPKVEMVRIVATAPNTTLTYDPPQPGAPASITQAGEWVEVANNDQDFRITASAPVLVAQYMEGQAAGGNSGDPAMTLAVAEDQYRKSYLFHSPTNYEYSYVNVVAPTGATVTLDGATVVGFSPIGATGYSVSRTSLSNAGSGDHTISSSQAFGISVYGYGQYTSYWYPGGSNLTKLHD